MPSLSVREVMRKSRSNHAAVQEAVSHDSSSQRQSEADQPPQCLQLSGVPKKVVSVGPATYLACGRRHSWSQGV